MRPFTFTIAIVPSRSRACHLAHVALIGLLFYAGWCLDAGAQSNSWTGSVSGHWESPDWSLGVLPGTNQTILFTNAGWKALGITANTAQNYPQTLWVDSVTISSPTNSFNTLLLNYAGFVTPLAANSLTVASNSAVVMASSALQVAGNLSVGGRFTESDGSQVSVGSLHLGNLGPAVYNLTNSTLSGGDIYIGGFPASFNQQGGTNMGSLYLQSAGQYDLFQGYMGGSIQLDGGSFNLYGSSVNGGQLQVNAGSFNLFGGSVVGWELKVDGGSFNLFGGSVDTEMTTLRGGSFNFYDGSVHRVIQLQGGSFNQWDGNLSAAIQFFSGRYHLAGGTLSCGNLDLPGNAGISAVTGSFLQTGGTNFAGEISIGLSGGQPGYGSYTLSNGVLIASSLVISSTENMVGSVDVFAFEQFGGIHTNGGVRLSGDADRYGNVRTSTYYLRDGLLSTPSIELYKGAFGQSGGTNQVGTVSMDMVSNYQLSGGWLTATNIYQNGGVYYTTDGGHRGQFGSFQQLGGTNQVSDTLWLGDLSKNMMSGGRLIAQNLQLNGGACFLHSGGTISIPGVLTLGNGTWDEQTAGGATFGTLQLTDSSSTLLLPTNGPCIINFGDSSSRSWPTQAVLVIERWNGSPLGNGQQQIVFGNSPSGLTAQQLNQIHGPIHLATTTPMGGGLLRGRRVKTHRGWGCSSQVHSPTNPIS